MADCRAVADPKELAGNVFGPEAIAHNVYNHILFSPTQVSKNLSLPPNQSSGLIGGRSRAGDRVIENFSFSTCTITALKQTPKEDDLQLSTSTSTTCTFQDFSSSEENPRVESHKKVCTITNPETACLSPSKDEGKDHSDEGEEEDKLPPEESVDFSAQDGSYTSAEDDNQIHTVEDFIKLHLTYSSEKTNKEAGKSPTSQENENENDQSCSVSVLQQLAQKTNEIIKHNQKLQQEIANLKKATSVQTKVLTKMLKRKQKRLQSSTKTKI